MLNRQNVSDAIKRLEEAVAAHEKAANRTTRLCTKLYELRKRSGHELVCEVEAYINTMTASPKEFEKAFSEYRVELQLFDGVVENMQRTVQSTTVKSTAGTGAGVAAGAATALLGPSAAMAVATTFGTASTGTAISALSGAAATKAALAWLGGGALAAGGGGMSAGTALLGLAGPVGWSLAGLAAAGGVAYMWHANGKAAEEADEKRLNVEADIRALKANSLAVKKLCDITTKHVDALRKMLTQLRDVDGLRDFNMSTEGQQNVLQAMINHVRSLGKLLNKTVDLEV